MNRQQLLDRVERAWSAFHESYAGLSDDRMMAPGVTGDWSVKDILAHIAIWEEEALKYLPVIMAGGKPPRYSVTYGGIDAFNAQMVAQWRAIPLSDVRQRLEMTHQRLLDLIRQTPEEQFLRETPFRHRLRLDTYSHYPIHTKSITAWRAAASAGSAPFA